MKRLLLPVSLAVAACAATVTMPPEVLERHRQEIMGLVAEGSTKEAWEDYFVLVNTSGGRQYPGILLEIVTAVLEQGVRAPDPAVRLRAVESLQYAGNEFAFEVAAGRLNDDDLAVRAAVIDLLRKLGRPEAIDLIRPQLKPLPAEERELYLTARLRAYENLQMHAVLALAALGEKSLPVAPAVKAMSSPDPGTRAVAARALGELGNLDALPSLRYGLEKDIEWQVNAAAAEALLDLGRRALVGRFAQDASRSEYPVKVAWSIDMRQYRNVGPTADWILAEGTYNRSGDVRARAAVALGEMGVAEAEPRLVEMLEYQEPVVRVSAAYALVRLGRPSRIRAIADAAVAGEPEVRARAMEFLAKLSGWKYAGVFRGLEEDPDPRVRLAAVLAFRPGPAGAIPPELAFEYLAWPVGDENDRVRFTAAALLRGARPQQK